MENIFLPSKSGVPSTPQCIQRGLQNNLLLPNVLSKYSDSTSVQKKKKKSYEC